MDEEEAALFLTALGALEAQSADAAPKTAETGLIESAEPMTATCEVEYSDE